MLIRFTLALLVGLLSVSVSAAEWLQTNSTAPPADAFVLAKPGQVADLVLASTEAPVVQTAAHLFATDLRRVTGLTPAQPATPGARPAVLIGTLGQSPLIDALLARTHLDLGDLRGAWESFIITTVEHPTPELERALVVIGSDPRGTAYGLVELSEAIGVSPWHGWADVIPAPHDTLLVAAGIRRFGPPSVKYRGIFLNDEDWGLQPWAARTLEPETGDIGPKTYARVFELMLRLKANTLWPAMHACTRPFNADPRNAALAHDYGIVMGSSHAEPLLRNNVGEWTAPKADYNYVTHRDDVRAYWAERLRTNGRYENLYTLGMRGVHDSGIQGATTDAERLAVLNQVIADQRDLLHDLVAPDVTRLPQIFCAYKEVLDLYRQGLAVPDDVTIVWPDDNFGYVRNFASPAEQKRSGGFGVYYHLSYLGRPLAYLWLGTTPPALIWSEMTKSYAHGANRVWIANVGDLKAAELTTEFFLRLAWDVSAFGPDAQRRFLSDWATRTFGSTLAEPIAEVLDGYFALNHQRRPEHLQWWTPLKEEPLGSPWDATTVARRRARFADLVARVEALAPQLPTRLRDAFFELVAYPVKGTALANERFFAGESGEAEPALAADAALHTLTAEFDKIANGKWAGFMRLEPADNDWRSMRIAPWQMPAYAPVTRAARAPGLTLDAAAATMPGNWTAVRGLGQSQHALVAKGDAPPSPLTYAVELAETGDWTVTLHRLPTHPVDATRGDTLRVRIDDGPWQDVAADLPDGSAVWSAGVLANRISHPARLGALTAGQHTLTMQACAGWALDQLTFTVAPPEPNATSGRLRESHVN